MTAAISGPTVERRALTHSNNLAAELFYRAKHLKQFHTLANE